jgi:BirA family transcriptional regulator, biotin operon repressor / biotin---[acetyl-CoA-carboxylase] ligase
MQRYQILSLFLMLNISLNSVLTKINSMKFIKLNAIDSTNDFLKDMSRNEVLENFMTVTAESQTKGKGQMGSKWESEQGKNIIMSTLVKEVLLDVNDIFHLNIAVSLAVCQVLESINIPNLSIKWPNDILSDQKKLAGILIENSFKSENRIESIVGIGLNVNQFDFSKLPKATSLSVVMNQEYDLEELIKKIVFQIRKNCALVVSHQSQLLWNEYHNRLFKNGIPSAFEDTDKNQFMGIIQKVTDEGKLQIILEDDTVKAFGVKEITMLY